MGSLRFVNGYDKQSDSKFAESVTAIAGEVTKQGQFFKNPDPAPDAIMEQVALFLQLVKDANLGSRSAVLLKNEKREEITNMVYNLSYYVLFTAKGDRTVAELSGMKLAKEPAPAPPIADPTGLQVFNTRQSGEIESSVHKVKGAKSYLHQYTTDPLLKEESWQNVVCTHRRCVISGLKPGTTYFVRVGAVGTKEQLKFSAVQSCIAA